MPVDHAAAEGDGLNDDQPLVVDAEVFALLPQVNQVILRDKQGRQYTLTRKIEGIDLGALRVGQIVRCSVDSELSRVLHAQVLS